MAELGDLMAEGVAALDGDLGDTELDDTGTDDETLGDEDQDDEELDDTQESETDDENEDAESDDDGKSDTTDKDKPTADDDEDDDFVVNLDDEEEDKQTPPVDQPKVPAAGLTDEGQYILSNLPKIGVRVMVPTADGKSKEIRSVEVYGWGDLPKDMLGFVTPYEQGVFTASAQNNELEARRLQGQYRQDKVKADTEAYTLRENRAIARDLRDLRKQGIFPKFKGLPGSEEFNSSEGAKEFDRVVAFMNEQNDEAGRAAQKGDAFYHISFKQAYRMLHPERFDTKRQAAQKQADKNMARRIKTGGGSRPGRNAQVRRVGNITDLADEFASFTGSSR